MKEKSNLATRMKSYESLYEYKLMSRLPTICRLDGKGFSKLTKSLKCEKPFDKKFLDWMSQATLALVEEAQDCVIGYTQSDEITLILTPNVGIESEAWFDNRIQKISSILSSTATGAFIISMNACGVSVKSLPKFDCRVHSVPSIEEAINNLRWRQRDCIKNSISSATYYEVGKKVGKGTARGMLDKLNQNQRQDLLFKETGINWADYPVELKQGIMFIKEELSVRTENGAVLRKKWICKPAISFLNDDGWNFLYQLIAPKRDDNVKEKKEAKKV